MAAISCFANRHISGWRTSIGGFAFLFLLVNHECSQKIKLGHLLVSLLYRMDFRQLQAVLRHVSWKNTDPAGLALVFLGDCSLLLQLLLVTDTEAWISCVLGAWQDALAVPVQSYDNFQVWNQLSTFVQCQSPTVLQISLILRTCLYLWNTWHVSESPDICPLLESI